jgi:chromate transporter
VNAAVVGLLLAALYKPTCTSGIGSATDFSIRIVALLLLTLWRVPSWLVVILGPVTASAMAG